MSSCCIFALASFTSYFRTLSVSTFSLQKQSTTADDRSASQAPHDLADKSGRMFEGVP